MRIFGKIWDYSGKQWNPVLGYFEKSWENIPTMGKLSCFQENKIPQFGKIWEYRGQDFGASLPVFGNYWENAGKYGVILGKYGIIFSQKNCYF